jgi:hypothetical protein
MMTRPISEQMTLWGQRYDQQVQSLRRAQDRAAAKDELVPLHVIEAHQTDMESLADQAANLISSAHVILDELQDWMPTWDGTPGHLHQIMEALVGGATMDAVR